VGADEIKNCNNARTLRERKNRFVVARQIFDRRAKAHLSSCRERSSSCNRNLFLGERQPTSGQYLAQVVDRFKFVSNFPEKIEICLGFSEGMLSINVAVADSQNTGFHSVDPDKSPL
jgi:hypothetical protein